jgi:MarR family transcriptional regulator for hemolysin
MPTRIGGVFHGTATAHHAAAPTHPFDIYRFDPQPLGMAAPDEPIGLLVARTAKAVGRAFDDALAHGDANRATWLVLASLAGGLRGSQRTIAAELGIEGATLTHHLNRLEAAGLVRRERDAGDRRTQQVELTGAGRARFSGLLGSVQAFDRQLRTNFADDELATLRELPGRLATNAAITTTSTDEGSPS